MNRWLLKTEPGAFSILDLAAAPDRTAPWDGVRNYQARNMMRDQMKRGDQVLFYHSVTDPGVVGLAEVVREGYPDHTAWEAGHVHFDARSTPDRALWFMVDVRLVEQFASPLALKFLRTVPELANMELLRKGSRLSVQPVSEGEFEVILDLAHGADRGGLE